MWGKRREKDRGWKMMYVEVGLLQVGDGRGRRG